MSRTRIVKGTYTKITHGNHYMFAEGSIITTAAGTITESGTEGGVVYGSPNKLADNKEKDFDISFSLNKNNKTVVPLGIMNFDNEYENPYFAFHYSLSLSNVESLDFEIKDADGNIIYQTIHLEPVIIRATNEPKMYERIPYTLPNPPEKTFDINSLFQGLSIPMGDHTQVGSYILYWEGFDNDNIYDSTRFNNKTLTAKITATKGGIRKSKEVQFTTAYDQVDWVDVKIDKNKKTIETIVRVNFRDGGAEGLEYWDKIPENAIKYNSGQQPIQERTKKFEELRDLALQGINTYWSRTFERTGGNGTSINGEKWEILTNSVQDSNGMIAPQIIFFTNKEETNFTRSHNWELSRKLFYIVGYTYDDDWKTYDKNSIVYLSEGWYFTKQLKAIKEFSETSAHEVGHHLLLKYGGDIQSKTHKGTSHWSMIIQNPNPGTTYPKEGEIDLMKYAEGRRPDDFHERVVIASEDLLGLIWLTKIKIK